MQNKIKLRILIALDVLLMCCSIYAYIYKYTETRKFLCNVPNVM